MVPQDEDEGGFLDHAISAFGYLLDASSKRDAPKRKQQEPKKRRVKARPEDDGECCLTRRKLRVRDEE